MNMIKERRERKLERLERLIGAKGVKLLEMIWARLLEEILMMKVNVLMFMKKKPT